METRPTTVSWLSIGVIEVLTARLMAESVASQRLAPMDSCHSMASRPGTMGVQSRIMDWGRKHQLKQQIMWKLVWKVSVEK